MRAFRAALLLAAAALTLGSFVARAWYARWVADDFCLALQPSPPHVYLTWSGRYTATFLIEAVTRLGPAGARWLAIGALVVWLAAAYAGVRSLAIAFGLVAAIVNATPDAFQPLIWTTGLMTYGVPIIGATIMAALIGSPPAVLFVLALIFGGCSEVAAAAQLVFAAALAIVMPRHRRALVSIAIGSAIAFAIVVAAPGNFARRTLYHPLPLPQALLGSLTNVVPVFAHILIDGCTLFVPLIVVLALERRASKRAAVAALLASFAIVAMTIFASLAGTGRLPWGRVEFVPVAYVGFALVFTALALRIERYATLATIVMTAFVIIGIATTRFDAVREARDFAAVSDRIAGAPHSIVAAPHDFDYLDYVTRDPNHWSNRCIADYYRLASIRSSR